MYMFICIYIYKYICIHMYIYIYIHSIMDISYGYTQIPNGVFIVAMRHWMHGFIE